MQNMEYLRQIMRYFYMRLHIGDVIGMVIHMLDQQLQLTIAQTKRKQTNRQHKTQQFHNRNKNSR